MISFVPLDWVHIPLMWRWFNRPHVQAFYSLREWSEGEVREKLGPVIRGEKSVFGFIVCIDETPIGYIQYYRLEEHPWSGQWISDEIVQAAAGLDLFIGELDAVGRGLGSQIVSKFLSQRVWNEYAYCFVDPDERNTASIRMFEKCGFQAHQRLPSSDAMNQAAVLELMVIQRPKTWMEFERA